MHNRSWDLFICLFFPVFVYRAIIINQLLFLFSFFFFQLELVSSDWYLNFSAYVQCHSNRKRVLWTVCTLQKWRWIKFFWNVLSFYSVFMDKNLQMHFYFSSSGCIMYMRVWLYVRNYVYYVKFRAKSIFTIFVFILIVFCSFFVLYTSLDMMFRILYIILCMK